MEATAGTTSSRKAKTIDQFFTPSPKRKPTSSPTAHREDQVPAHARSHAYAYGLEHVAQAYGLEPPSGQSHSTAYGRAAVLRGNSYGFAARATGNAYGLAARTETRALPSNVRSTARSHRAPRHGAGAVYMTPFPIATPATIELGAPPAPHAMSAAARAQSQWDVPDLDTLTIEDEERLSHHGVVFRDRHEPQMSEHSYRSQPASVRSRSHHATSQHDGSHRSGRSTASNSGSSWGALSVHSNLSANSLARHDSEIRASDAAFEAAERCRAESSNQFHALHAIMKKQNDTVENFQTIMKEQCDTVEDLRRELATQKLQQADYTEGPDGVEPWVAEAQIAEDLKVTHKWWFGAKKRWENEDETMLRSRIYSHLTEQLPSEMYSQEPDNDMCEQFLSTSSLWARRKPMSRS